MGTRRNFLKIGALGVGVLLTRCGIARDETTPPPESPAEESNSLPKFDPGQAPVVISTWNHGLAANAGAWPLLVEGGSALDAVEMGVRVTESDPASQSVGYGGLPDRDGRVTLDACIMNAAGDCGAVACLQHIENPISVARKVMEDTPHVMLVGEGAYQFAREKGFPRKDLLTEASRNAWQEWRKEAKYEPVINRENHDTIGMLALDANGDLAGACTTSGMAWKMHGRVGDSPIIGAGLFVDNEVGAACATGVGEAVIRVAGSHLVVEFMRQGKSPETACRLAVERILHKHKDHKNLQVGFLALNKAGQFGGYAVYEGFNFAHTKAHTHEMIDAGYQLKW
ncbi:MAG: N(4)-(beta-N-acetylglucosaminyl)-L-asparaginase [Bacteroidota bacterium]